MHLRVWRCAASRAIGLAVKPEQETCFFEGLGARDVAGVDFFQLLEAIEAQGNLDAPALGGGDVRRKAALFLEKHADGRARGGDVVLDAAQRRVDPFTLLGQPIHVWIIRRKVCVDLIDHILKDRCFCSAATVVSAWAAAMTAYAELVAMSNFSFLRGASHPEELVVQAKALGLDAIALCARTASPASCVPTARRRRTASATFPAAAWC
jgi:hypothetical protein